MKTESSEFVRINAPRIEKIIAALEVIERSARSNKVSDEDITRLLRPIADHLAKLGDGPDGPTPKATTSHWHNAIEMARTAPLGDVSAALTVFADRLDQHFHDTKG